MSFCTRKLLQRLINKLFCWFYDIASFIINFLSFFYDVLSVFLLFLPELNKLPLKDLICNKTLLVLFDDDPGTNRTKSFLMLFFSLLLNAVVVNIILHDFGLISCSSYMYHTLNCIETNRKTYKK